MPKQHQPKTINPIPVPEVMAAWKADYKKMLEEMIYEQNAPSFEEMISELKNLKNKINALGSKFESDFPLPKKIISH